MAKYSYEFKQNVVQSYMNGEGSYDCLAKKYNIPSCTPIKEWVAAFKEFGKEGLLRSRKKKNYSFQFKLYVVELYLSSEVSYQDLAISQGINNSSLIAKWVNDFRIAGPDALRPKKRGRRKSLDTHKATWRWKLKIKDRECIFKRTEETAFRGRSSTEKTARIVHSLRGQFKLKDILAVAGLPKATYMYWQKRFDRENPNKELENKIIEIREEHKNFGYRRVCGELKNQGIKANKKRVQRIMQKLNLQVTSFTRKSRKYSSYKGNIGKIAPNRINRRFHTSVPHQKITTDTTEFKYYEIDSKGRMVIKKLYLDPFLDMFNGEVLSYGISKNPSATSVLAAQKEAIEITSDCLYRRTFHSDRGWAYQMKAYSNALKENKIFQSMSRKGNCYDNSVMENFFGILKQEMYYGTTYYSFDELKEAIEKYIKYYNEKRIKEKLGWMSPVQYRLNAMAA